MIKKPVILYRQNDKLIFESEFDIVHDYFSIYEYRCGIPFNSLVVGRYSVLPYYKELCIDLEYRNSELVNSFSQHLYIVNMRWYTDIIQYTPKTYFWDDIISIPDNIPLIVKGNINSKKFEWKNKMFAENKKRAITIACDLHNDSLIGEQDIIFKEYVPLKTFEKGINDLPFTNEWRVFFYKSKALCSGYYWSISENAEDINRQNIPNDALQLAQTCANIISNNVNFFTIDVAEKEDGGWIVIEVNDGQMSGMCLCDPDVLYSRLKIELLNMPS